MNKAQVAIAGVLLVLVSMALLGVIASTPQNQNSSSSISTTSPPSSSATPTASSVTTGSFVLPSSCHSLGGLPDPNCTPGATNPDVTQATVQSTICVSGYTSTIRPPVSYTNNLKRQSIQLYGYSDTNMSHYEEDHLIALEIGGSPMDVRNLWAEPHYGNYAADDKDKFENYLHSQVCNGKISLAEAQHEMATNWIQYWLASRGTQPTSTQR